MKIFPFQADKEENKNYETLLSELKNIQYKGKGFHKLCGVRINVGKTCSHKHYKGFSPDGFSRAISTGGSFATELSSPT